MEETETKFLEDQRNERKIFSTDSIDSRWGKTMERKLKQEKVLEMIKEKEAKEYLLGRMESDENVKIHTENECDSDLFEDQTISRLKRKLVAIEFTPDSDDSMPESFKQTESCINVVRPEFYSTVDLLISRYHCSKVRAVAGIIKTEKSMFGREYWKYHTENTTCLDLDTASHNKNI